MPTPVGHLMGGMATALLADAAAPRRSLTPRLLLACAAVAIGPDLDLLVGSHRTVTHSVGASAIVALTAWLLLRRGARPVQAALALGAAHASHVLLDWLGRDTSPPVGLMALWPFSREFYVSGAEVFAAVSRRYWLPTDFLVGNLLAIGREVLLLGPVLVVAVVVWRRRTRLAHACRSR